MRRKLKLLSLMLAGALLLNVPLGFAQEDGMEEERVPVAETTEPEPVFTEEETEYTLTPQTDAVPAGETTEPEIAVLAAEPEEMTQEEYFQSTIDQYQKFGMKDPQLIRDESLFGVWDHAKNDWSTEPLLNYEKFPALSNVETSVKDGDYASAKSYLLEYGRAKIKSNKRTTSPITDERTLLTNQMYFENLAVLTGKGEAIEKLSLTGQEQTFVADVTKDLRAASTAVTRERGFMMMALKKDGYQASFYSKEAGEKGPYIEANVNGSVVKFYPKGDATVRAGKYKNQKYGDKTDLLVEESLSSVGNGKQVDDYTKKAYMLFDFQSLNPGDDISSAKLYVRGKMEASDNPRKPEQVKTKKDVVLFQVVEVGWDEKNITWNNREHAMVSYDGESTPHLNQLTEVPTIHSWVGNLTGPKYPTSMARCYLGTGEEAYAYHALRYLMNTITRLGTNVNIVGGSVDNLSLAGRTKDYPLLLFMLADSEYMTPDIYTTVVKNQYMMAQKLVEAWNYSSEANNWGVSEAAGLLTVAVNFPEFKAADEPLKNGGYGNGKLGGWRAVANHRLAYKAKKDLFSDGSCIEVGMGYTSYDLDCFRTAFEQLESVGIPAKDFFEEETLQEIQKYCLYLMNVSTPTYGDWQQGHGYGHDSNYRSEGQWGFVVKVTQHPYLVWAMTNGREGEKPPYMSIVYDVGKKAVLRTDWNNSETVAAQINADGGQKSHGQNDDLGLNVYGYGQHLLVDPLYNNYNTTTDARTAWLASTRAHNTVEINEVSQKGSKNATMTGPVGEPLYTPNGGVMGNMHPENRELNNMYDFLQVETLNYKNYPAPEKLKANFDVKRDVLFIKPGYFIVTDHIKPNNNTEHQYNQNWHMLPNAKLTLDEATNQTDVSLNGAGLLIAPVAQKQPLQGSVRDGWYSPSQSNTVAAKYISYEQKAVGTVTMNTVLYPYKGGSAVAIDTEQLETNAPESSVSAFRYEISDQKADNQETAAFYSVHENTAKAQRDFDTFSTDGSLAFVSRSGNQNNMAILRNGTNLTDRSSGTFLVKSNGTVDDLGIRWQADELLLESSKDIDWTGLTVCVNKTISKVKFNGVEKSFKQQGQYIYFGDKPVVDDDTTLPEEKPFEPGGGGGGDGHGGGTTGGGTGTQPIGPQPTPTPDQPDNKIPQSMQQELEGHWGQKEITEMLEKGIVKGIDNHSLGLTQTTTRAEFITMLVRALELKERTYQNEFEDVGADAWYASAFATAKEYGLMEGDDGMAHPDEAISREEMAKILVCAYESKYGTNSQVENVSFADREDISPWAAEYVDKAVALGLMKGMEYGFAPRENALREQAIVVVCRLLHLV